MMRFLFILALVTSLAIILYGRTLEYGFDLDDYHQVRPYTMAEVGGSFRGPWDPTGIEAPFYRPLTVALFAVRFHVFGFDARRYHWASILAFSLAAILLGVFLLRVSGSLRVASTGALLFTVHPAMPYSLVAWAANQPHLIQLSIFLLALLWWVVCRDRSTVWWIPLIPLEAIAFLLKEDGIMLLICVLLIHTVYGWTLADRRIVQPARWFYVASGLTILGLMVLRHAALGELGGYRLHGWQSAVSNELRGPYHVLVHGGHRLRVLAAEGGLINTLFVTGTTAAGMWIAARNKRWGLARFCISMGLVIMGTFNIPYLFQTKVYQWHFLALGGVLVLLGSIEAVYNVLESVSLRLGFVVLLLGAVLNMGRVTRAIAEDFSPYSPNTLAHDAQVLSWGDRVPPELRRVILQKRDQ